MPVPKFTVIIGGSHGAGNYGMCGRAYDPRFLFMWPNARISVMGGPQATDVLATVKWIRSNERSGSMSEEEYEAVRAPILEKYEREGSPTIPQHGSGMMASSTRGTHATCSAWRWLQHGMLRYLTRATACSGCESQLENRFSNWNVIQWTFPQPLMSSASRSMARS